MGLGDRIKDQLAVIGISQSELARRIGVTQSTINGLIRGEQRSTTKLHLIARELRVTSAFLSGETDDPAGESPDFEITSEERQIVELFRNLPPAERSAATLLIRSLATSARSPSVHG
jgi:transcriptional regulator with XRE-family HTH domain